MAPGARVIPTGGALMLTATARDAAGNVVSGRSVQWTSSAPAVARVSADGQVTGVATGTAQITATVDGQSASAPLTVAFAVSTADFGSAVASPKSMSGLLHGLTVKGAPAPPGAVFAPLRPAIWRATPNVVPTALAGSVGARYQVILSDFWGYPVDHWPNGRPYENVAAYRDLVRRTAESLNGQVASWEIWNEPDPAFGPNFWDGTEQQFFQTYLEAYRVLRDVLGPAALIVGPSLSRYDAGYLKRFADFCVANGCEANVLTWHEMGADRPLSVIADHLRAARRDFVDNPAYAALRVREIHVNESVGPTETYNPAASLTYLQYLELGGADAAARACWPDASNVSDCFNNSLDGLITPTTAQPRGVWWAYKAYADGAATRVQSASTDPRVLSLASRSGNSAEQVQVLVGYSDVNNGQMPAEAVLAARLTRLDAVTALAGRTRVRATVMEIPHTGASPLTTPLAMSALEVEVVDGAVEIVIPRAKANAVYVVALQAPP